MYYTLIQLNLSIYLIYLSFFLSFYLIYLSIHPSIHLSIYISIYLCFYIYTFLSVSYSSLSLCLFYVCFISVSISVSHFHSVFTSELHLESISVCLSTYLTRACLPHWVSLPKKVSPFFLVGFARTFWGIR